MYWQNGDVLFHAVDEIPKDAAEVWDTNIIIKGVSGTGHNHTFEGGDAKVFTRDDGQTWLYVADEITLRHDEHLPMTLPPGRYRVDMIRKYDHIRKRREM